MSAEKAGGQSDPSRTETEKDLVVQAVIVGGIVLVVVLLVLLGVI